MKMEYIDLTIQFNTCFDPEDDLRDDISYGDYLYEDE